jgi:flagellin
MLVSLNQQTNTLAQRLARLQPALDDSIARLSSGSRLTRPADDPIGVGLVARYEARQKRLEAAEINLQNGASRLQTTDSLLGGLAQALGRMGELATLSQNAVMNADDRQNYASEFKSLQEQIRNVIGGTTAEIGGTTDVPSPQGAFQGRELFGPPPAGGEVLYAGADEDAKITLPDINLRQGSVLAIFAQDPGGAFTLTIDNPNAVTMLSAATGQLSLGRSAVGGAQSRIEFASSAITTAQTNAEAALSRIRDTNVATETTLLTRRQMVEEANTAMLAQAREVPRQLLPLLSSR